jgi:hypothetical protein
MSHTVTPPAYNPCDIVSILRPSKGLRLFPGHLIYTPCCCPFAGTPDHRVQLTAKGHAQALKAGQALKELMGPDGRAYFYVSPYVRTLQTAQDIGSCLDRDQVGTAVCAVLEGGSIQCSHVTCAVRRRVESCKGTGLVHGRTE